MVYLRQRVVPFQVGGRHMPTWRDRGSSMADRKRGRVRETFSVVVIVFLTLILFPWPILLLSVLGVPPGSSPYFVVLAAVIGFAAFTEHVRRREWPPPL